MIKRYGLINIIFLGGVLHFGLASYILNKFVPVGSFFPGNTFFYLFSTSSEFLREKILFSHGLASLPFVGIAFTHFNKKKGIYGDARFAFDWEVKDKIKNATSGIFLCYLGRLKVILKGSFHFLITAETRAGKGVSWIVPTILTWQDSAIIFDLKGELFKFTSWYKKLTGHQVYYIDFMAKDGKSDCNNVFDYLPECRNEKISFIQKVAEFIQPTPSSGDPMWSSSARSLFNGLALLADACPTLNLSMGEIYRMLHTEQATHVYLKDMIEEHSDILDPICKMELWDFINTPDKTRGGVKKQLTGTLKIFANPTVDAATSNSSFDLRNVRKEKMTIYVSAPVDYLEAVAPAVRLFYQFAIDLNLVDPDDEGLAPSFIQKLLIPFKTKKNTVNNPYKCLLLLDEFLAIGYMGVIANKIAYVAGYGLNLMLIIQSKAQLRNEYKDNAQAIEENCQVRGFLTPNLRKTAEELSNELGYTTILHTNSRSKDWLGVLPKNVNTGDAKKALMLPEELQRLPEDKCIIFVKGIWPILGKRAVYYSDKNFKKLIKPPINIPELNIPFHDILTSGSDSNTIEVDIDDLNLGDFDKNTIISDEECVNAAQEYFKQMGIN